MTHVTQREQVPQDAHFVILKFLSPENLSKYAEFIPQFEEAAEHLADLLIAARIGLSVEERPIKTAMESMSMVVKQLKTVKGK